MLVADNKDAAIAVLRRQQIVVTAVKEKGKELAVPKWGGKVPAQLVAIFTRQFSVMIDAGLPLVQCLEILGSQQENKTFKRSLLQIRQDVESGSTLADAMRKHPKIFNDLYTNMVAAGEAGGILDTILQRLAAYIEKSVKLNAQVKSAMIYPVAVISIAVLVVAIILWKVIPVFEALFKGLGAELPLPTVVVIALSNFIADFWWLMTILIIGFVVFI
ncbi:MAG TPA: type II secretion system F family protein, partial [Thermoanaerobaculia bacterium]